MGVGSPDQFWWHPCLCVRETAAVGDVMSSALAPQDAQADLEQVIARIESTALGYEDHGIFSLNVTFTYGSSSQGTGHYCVCSNKSDNPADANGIRLVKAIVDACGVSRWEDLKGRTVFVLKEQGWNGMVRGIAPLPTEKGKAVVFADLLEEESA